MKNLFEASIGGQREAKPEKQEGIQWWRPVTRQSPHIEHAAMGWIHHALGAPGVVDIEFSTPRGEVHIEFEDVAPKTIRFRTDDNYNDGEIGVPLVIEIFPHSEEPIFVPTTFSKLAKGVDVPLPFKHGQEGWDFRIGLAQ